MNKRTKYWVRRILFFCFLIMIGFVLYQVVLESNGEARPDVGQNAPDFTLTDITGKKVTLSDLRGKAVLLNFWATWCSPCRAEMPALEAAFQKHQKQGLVIVGVNIAETDVQVESFQKQYRLTFPLLLDPDRRVVHLYKIGPIPTSIFIDNKGKIVRRVEGALSLPQLEPYIQAILPKG